MITGGFSAEELARIEKRAYALGVKSYVALDVTQDYYQHAIKYMIFGNVLKNSTYPISVSSERISQATAIARYASSGSVSLEVSVSLPPTDVPQIP